MKKIILTFTICFFIFLNINLEKEIIPTFNAVNNDSSFYILEFKGQNISTNNFDDYFKNIDVIWIEPYINPLYKQVKTRYQFKNINDFKQEFVNLLIKKGYRSNALNLKISGIKIKKMKVYSSESTIRNLKIENMTFDIIDS